MIFARARGRLRRMVIRAGGFWNFYERTYELLAKTLPPEQSVGGGDFEQFGRIHLGLLRLEGLEPRHTVVDLGCGIGRLAAQIVPILVEGRFIGIDISRTMLREAARRTPASACKVEWKHQREPRFDLPDASVDFMTAFSVFTHMEPEDTLRYLRDAVRVVRPGGKFLLSCLPLSLPMAREILQNSARMTLVQRWSQVRDFVTTEETIETIGSLAGWKTLRWYRGDQPAAPGLPPLGQSVCVLQRPC